MLNNGRTVLRFPRPRTGRFAIYLLGEALPTSEDDQVVFPLPFYSSPDRVPGELLDEDARDATTPVNQGVQAPDPNTLAS